MNNIKLAVYYCHPGTCQTTQKKLVRFYIIITLKHKKVVKTFVKTLFYDKKKHSFIELTYVVGTHWNCLSMRQGPRTVLMKDCP